MLNKERRDTSMDIIALSNLLQAGLSIWEGIEEQCKSIAIGIPIAITIAITSTAYVP